MSEQSISPTLPIKVIQFAEQVQRAGGTAYIAGGFVRDMLLNIPCKDIDLEIHGIEPDVLANMMTAFQPVKAVGKSFGVWKLLPQTPDDLEIDVAIPNHQGNVAPHLGIKGACQRRDLTINAILYNIHTQTLEDPFHGIEDLKARRLNATDPLCFSEDLLRVFRVGQFAGRFGAQTTAELTALCQKLTTEPDFLTLAAERVLVKLQKGWLKSPDPTGAIHTWINTRALQTYIPELTPIVAPESPIWKAFEVGMEHRHTDKGYSMGLFWSILLQQLSPANVEAIFDRFGINKYLGFPVRQAVLSSQLFCQELGSQHSTVIQNKAREAFDLTFLCTVAHCFYPNGSAFDNLQSAKHRGILDTPLQRLIHGGDLLDLGIKGPLVGQILQQIRLAQLEETIQTREEAEKMLRTILEQSS